MEDPSTKTTSLPQKSYLLSCLLKLAAAANVQITKATQAVYLEQLSQLTRYQIENAVQRTIMEWDKPNMMPPISFILARGAQSAGLDEETLAVQGWSGVQAEIRRVGVYRGQYNCEPHIFDAATEHAVRQVGGYIRLCNLTADNDGKDPTPFVRRDFIAAHKHFDRSNGAVALTAGEAKALISDLTKKLGDQQKAGQ